MLVSASRFEAELKTLPDWAYLVLGLKCIKSFTARAPSPHNARLLKRVLELKGKSPREIKVILARSPALRGIIEEKRRQGVLLENLAHLYGHPAFPPYYRQAQRPMLAAS